jgi:hypothetical protein
MGEAGSLRLWSRELSAPRSVKQGRQKLDPEGSGCASRSILQKE